MLNAKYFLEREAVEPQFSNTSLLTFPSNVQLNGFFQGNVKLGFGLTCILLALGIYYSFVMYYDVKKKETNISCDK